jgi:hypothetical protein
MMRFARSADVMGPPPATSGHLLIMFTPVDDSTQQPCTDFQRLASSRSLRTFFSRPSGRLKRVRLH